MESYKERMKNEYNELKVRYYKLSNMINKHYNNELDFVLTCPITVLESQLHIMAAYLSILEYRAELEGFDIDEGD